MAEGNTFKLKIITPDRIFYEGEASMVEFNTTEGEIGVYRAHVPTTVIVAPGILTITESDGQKEAALHAGFAEILQERVTIMAEIYLRCKQRSAASLQQHHNFPEGSGKQP